MADDTSDSSMSGQANTFDVVKPMLKDTYASCKSCGKKFAVRAPRTSKIKQPSLNNAGKFGKLKNLLK